MAKINKSQKSWGFIFSTKSGGCRGFNYSLNLLDDSKYNPDNIRILPTVIEHQKKKLMVDLMSEMMLLGVTMRMGNI